MGSPGSGREDSATVHPPSSYYGDIRYGFRSTCSFALGAAVGYSSASAARSAALNQCSGAGGRNCTGRVTFGSAYPGRTCAAVAYGERGSGCNDGLGTGTSRASAELKALAECRPGGYSCGIVTTACTSSGPSSATSQTFGRTSTEQRPPPHACFRTAAGQCAARTWKRYTKSGSGWSGDCSLCACTKHIIENCDLSGGNLVRAKRWIVSENDSYALYYGSNRANSADSDCLYASG